MHDQSPNRQYRLVWNDQTQSFQVAPETARGCGKRSSRSRLKAVVSAIGALAAAGALAAGPGSAVLPSGAQVVGGTGTISTQGSALVVQQSSARLAVNWDSFNIGAGNRVEFVMPSSSSVALNRVVGADASVIQGQLSANGHVFLVNPNGVLFSRSAQVDVGGLVASTLDLSAQDFMAGRTVFSGTSRASVVNQGTIRAAEGGAIALIAGRIVNEGSLTAPRGQVGLGAGDKVTLDLGGPTLLQVENRTLETLIESGGVIRADGGRILVTSRAADELTRSVINHTGVIEAGSMGVGADGQVVLFAVGGTLNLSGSVKAEGGFVETSGKFFNTLAGAEVKARDWLIDPVNVNIDAALASSIQTALGSGNVTVTTDGACTGVTCSGSGTEGDITVNSPLAWSANQLTLRADRNIVVNQNITVSGSGTLHTYFGQGSSDGAGSSYSTASGVSVKVPLPGGTETNATSGFRWKKGSAGSTNELVLNNGSLAFGVTGAGSTTAANTSSINSKGILVQPYYYDNVNSGRNGFYKLTFSNYPLDLQLGTGTSGTNWNGNSTFASTNGTFTILTGGYVEIGGYQPGVGSGPGGGPKGSGVIESVVPVSIGTSVATVRNRYELEYDKSFIKVTTTITATTGALDNLGLWVGTRDDYVGTRDNQTKTMGSFDGSGAFVPATADGQPSSVLKINEFTNNTGAAVLFYSTDTSARVTFASCCSFSNATSVNPTAQVVTRTNDGSYALYSGFGSLANGSSGSIVWYYAAAPAQNIGAVSSSVANSAGVSTGPTPVSYTFPALTGTYTYQGTAYSLSNLFSSSSIFGSSYSSWVPGTDYTFQHNGSTVTGFANAGTYSNITVNVLRSGFTTATTGNTAGNFTIVPAPLTVTANNALSTYNGAGYTGGNGVTYSGFVNGETSAVLGGTLTYVGSSQGAINAGNYVITPSGLSSSNYTITNASGTLTIDPRPISVAADAKTKTYGDADPALTWSVTSGSLVGTDTLTGSLTRTAGQNAGTYTIDASTLSNSNYAISRSNGTFTINPRAITVTAASTTKVYGNADPALTWSLTSGTILSGDRLSGSLDRFPGENVGTYLISGSQLSNPNYSISVVPGSLQITPRPITVTLNSATKVYGDADPALGWRVTSGSLAFNDTLSGLVTRTTGNNVGTYVISGAALSNSNYRITANDGSLTITPRPISLTADSKTKTYGDADPALTWSLTSGSLVAGDTLGGSLTRAAGSDVGSYTIDASGLFNRNYAITASNGTLSIAPRPISIAIDSKTKTYGDADPALTWSLASGSLVAGDTLGGSLTRAAGADVGTYAIDASGLFNRNYAITAGTGALTITPRLISIAADAKTKTYGDADPGFTWSITSGSLVSGDSLRGAITRAAGQDVGTYALDASGLSNRNYVIMASNNVLTIAPRPITVMADAKTKTYGDADPSLTWSISAGSLVAGDSLGGTLSRAAGSNVGTYAIDASGLFNRNYAITARNGEFTIAPRAISIAADSKTKTYGDADPALTWSIRSGSLLAGDTLTGALSRTAGSDVGTYLIGASGLSNPNYTITASLGTFTITPRAITVVADSKSKTYGDADPALTWSLASGSLVGSDTLAGALSRASGNNVGSYAIDASGLSNRNYAITARNGTLTINARPITVQAESKTKTYGDADPTWTWKVVSGNLVGTDTMNGSLTRIAGNNAGTYTIDTAGISNPNYDITRLNGLLTIAPRPITVQADSKTKTYGSPDPAWTWTLVSGTLVGQDTMSGSLTRSSGSNAGAYTIDASGIFNPNYAITRLNGTLTISPTPITIVADNKTISFGDPDPSFTWRLASGSLLSGDTLLGSVTRAPGSGAGTYAIDLSNLVNPNYLITRQNGTLTVLPALPTTTSNTTISNTTGTASLPPVMQNAIWWLGTPNPTPPAQQPMAFEFKPLPGLPGFMAPLFGWVTTGQLAQSPGNTGSVSFNNVVVGVQTLAQGNVIPELGNSPLRQPTPDELQRMMGR